jgi:hypothetical protein
MPIAGLGGIDIRTSEDDWVVTGVHRGEPFRRYVSPNTSSENAIALVAQILKLTPNGLQWIRAQRRHEVERCIRMDGDWLRSRTI